MNSLTLCLVATGVLSLASHNVHGQYASAPEESLNIFARTRFARQGYGSGPVEEIPVSLPYKNQPVIEKLPNYGGGGGGGGESYGKSPAPYGGEQFQQPQSFGNGGGGYGGGNQGNFGKPVGQMNFGGKPGISFSGGGDYSGGGGQANFEKPNQYGSGGGGLGHGGGHAGHHRQPSNFGSKSPIAFNGGGGGYGSPQKQQREPLGNNGGFGTGGDGYGNSAPLLNQQYNQQPAFSGGQSGFGKQPGFNSYGQAPIASQSQGAGGYGR